MDNEGRGLQLGCCLDDIADNGRHVLVQFLRSCLAVSNNLDHTAVAYLDRYINTFDGDPGKAIHPNTAAVFSHTGR